MGDGKILDKMKRAPAWYLYFEMENLPSWLEPINQQFFGLALSTIINSIWAKKVCERSNSAFTEMLQVLHVDPVRCQLGRPDPRRFPAALPGF